MPLAILLGLLFSGCATPPPEAEVELESASPVVETEGRVSLSLYINTSQKEKPHATWKSSAGKIVPTLVAGEVDFIAPKIPQEVQIRASVVFHTQTIQRELTITVKTAKALKKTADILITVDTTTLEEVWVDEVHPQESFHPPLRIKGTFRFDQDGGTAQSGGNWTEYLMYDDGSHGDATENDGIWSLLMHFEKSTEKVYFAFDETSPYRVQWESGLAWRMKVAWIDLDDFPDDLSNPAFIPDHDKTVAWTAEMATQGRIYEATD